MHIFSNLKNFLYDNDNFISIFDNKIYLYNITKIDNISSNLIILYFNNKKIEIKGNNFIPIKSLNKEILFKGNIESVNFYE